MMFSPPALALKRCVLDERLVGDDDASGVYRTLPGVALDVLGQVEQALWTLGSVS